MQTAQNMSGSTTVSTPPPGSGSAATNTTTPANASAASAPPAFVPDAAQVRKAQVALMRFGLGPKAGTFGEFVSSTDPDIARKLCRAEIDNYAEYIRQKSSYDQQARTGSPFRGSKLSNAQLAEFGAGIVLTHQHATIGREELTLQNCCLNGITTHGSGSVMNAEIAHRIAMGLKPKVGFVERLVHFWANHFSMFKGKSHYVRALLGHYERTVIRRHVLGNFSDMLVETIKHPAMIQYLDNQSSGGMSRAAVDAPSRPLANQNLAREILELHTMGTGHQFGQRLAYDQADVEALSMMLTGWNINYRGGNELRNVTGEATWRAAYPNYAQFEFVPTKHHEGTYVMMGRSYSGVGQQKAIDALRYLASLNSTSIHLSTKLLKHFVTDNPPQSMVLRLNHHFQRSNGNLLVVARELLNIQEAWDAPFERIRPPALWMTSMCRALNMQPSEFLNVNNWEFRMDPLRNGTWNWITPDGFPDKDPAWVEPNAMRVRTSLSTQILLDAAFRRSSDPSLPALPTAAELYAGTLPWVSRPWVARGERYSNNQSISALFLSPDYMTR